MKSVNEHREREIETPKLIVMTWESSAMKYSTQCGIVFQHKLIYETMHIYKQAITMHIEANAIVFDP